MKPLNLIPIAVLVIVCVGCASTSRLTLSQPVGPDPSVPAQTHEGGVLEVFSAFQVAPIDPNLESFFEGESLLKGTEHLPAHTAYRIYDSDGKVLQTVQNSKDLADDQPTLVTLPPGRYQVEAEAETHNREQTLVRVPVVIEPLRTTVVHLAGNWVPPGHYTSADVVALPDGRIAGWRAHLAALHAASSSSASKQ